MAPGDAEDIRTRLRRALPAAMKARDRTAVAALRSALAAIDNAEAVEAGNPPPPTPPAQAPAAAPDAAAAPDQPPAAPGQPSSAAGRPSAAPDRPSGAANQPSGAPDQPSGAPDRPSGASAPVTPATGTGSRPGAGGSPVAGAVVGLGAGEVERRSLTAAEIEAIVRREVIERRTAARAYQDAGRPDHADRLRAEADLLGSYLDDPDPPP